MYIGNSCFPISVKLKFRERYFIASRLTIPFIDDVEYLRAISERVYLEEAGYWGLVALQEREKEYVDVGDANDEKYFG